MKMRRIVFMLLMVASLVALPMRAKAQTFSESGVSTSVAPNASLDQVDLTYTRPSESTKVHDYLFDGFGPYPIVAAATVAGVNQAYSTPPEWGQGAAGFGRRFGSNFGIAAVSTTTRYALSEAFKEDGSYYRCVCTGFVPRLGHAVISTLTARRGDDGYRVFSFPAFFSPYAGTMTAVYGWYPDRFGPKDAFRMGNYNLLGFVGGNIALEFIYGGPHSLFSRMHLANTHSAPEPGSSR
jgi:hypothetical protein